MHDIQRYPKYCWLVPLWLVDTNYVFFLQTMFDVKLFAVTKRSKQLTAGPIPLS